MTESITDTRLAEMRGKALAAAADLRRLLPEQVDYAALVCAEGFAHGQHYVWTDPEPYAMDAAAKAIGEMLSENDRLTAELAEYQALAADYDIDGKMMLTLAKSQIEMAKENAKLTAELAEYQTWEMTPSEYREGVNFILKLNKAIKQATGKTVLDWEQLEVQNAELLQKTQRLEADNANLTEQLKAAVDDLYRIASCDACKHYDADKDACGKPFVESFKCFIWRGEGSE